MRGRFQSTARLAVLGLGLIVPTLAPAQPMPEGPAAAVSAPTDQELPAPIRIDQGSTSPWARYPVPEYPERALSRGLDGRVTLRCGYDETGALTTCEVAEETPLGAGFGPATLAGARRGRLAQHILDQIPAGARVAYTVNFRLPPEPPRLSVIEDPSWTRPPRPAFPRSPRSAGITSARVRLDCEIIPYTGRLRNCSATEESHPGRGFVAAALRAVREASVSRSVLNQAAPDAHAVFDVTFSR